MHDGTHAMLDVIVVLAGGKKIVDNATVMQLHCPTSMVMAKIWPDGKVYESIFKMYISNSNS